MSILLRTILGTRDYLTYYYAIQTLSDSHAHYSIVHDGGRLSSKYSQMCDEIHDKMHTEICDKIHDKIHNDTHDIIKSLMFNKNFCLNLFYCGRTFEKNFKNLEFLIIPPDISNSESFYKTIYFLENLKTLVVIQPNDTKIFNVLRTLPFTLKTLFLENIEPSDVKYLDNLPINLEKVIFIHLLDKYEQSKEIFKNMKLPFDCNVRHLVKKNLNTTVVFDYNKLSNK